MKYFINGSNINKNILSEESLNIMCKEIDSSYESYYKAVDAQSSNLNSSSNKLFTS